MLDNVGAFRQAYETTDRQRYVDMLTAIASEGRGVGVHLCVASSERAGIHTTLSSAIQRRIVLRMPTEDDYSLLGVPVDVLDTHSVPGRGVDHEIEIQVGVLGEQQDDAYQAERIRDMAAALSAAGVSQAPPIRSLAQAVTLRDIGRAAQEVTIGLASSSLAPIGVDARGGFLITGPPGSGRTKHFAESDRFRATLESRRSVALFRQSTIDDRLTAGVGVDQPLRSTTSSNAQRCWRARSLGLCPASGSLSSPKEPVTS